MNTKQKTNDTSLVLSLVLYAFIGMCIGAFLGLLSYVNDWI